MDLLPLDILKLINENICDVDFINLISASKTMYGLREYNLKILTEQYSISKIQHIIDTYTFRNIYYDLLEWNVQLIPTAIEKIKFIDEFNENFSELFDMAKYKSLKHVDIGIFYVNGDIFNEEIPNTININELCMTLITNKIFIDWCKDDIERLHNIKSNNRFPSYLNKLFIAKIKEAKYRNKSLDEFQNIPSIRHESVTFINSYIDSNKYEALYYMTNIKKATIEQLNFYKFYPIKIQENIRKLIDKIYNKYNFKNFDDYLTAMWGKEIVEEIKRKYKEKELKRKIKKDSIK